MPVRLGVLPAAAAFFVALSFLPATGLSGPGV